MNIDVKVKVYLDDAVRFLEEAIKELEEGVRDGDQIKIRDTAEKAWNTVIQQVTPLCYIISVKPLLVIGRGGRS